ncbi:hypothetical protein [Haloarchaeobius sp. HRN-SO-5]|uniref:hypothetical protein n=1 Tax=Haloarchaeobius sp. HRN-SO-5 TaxID=3446118 RepID=UPI003EBD0073
MDTDELLHSIRRWLITATFLLAILVHYQASGSYADAGPDGWNELVQLVAFGVALVAALWLWHSFRGPSDAGDRPTQTQATDAQSNTGE